MAGAPLGAALPIRGCSAAAGAEESEAAYFARAERACRASDAAAAYRALGAWASRAGEGSIEAWCRELGDAGLRREITVLETTLFAAPTPAGSRMAGPWHLPSPVPTPAG